MPKTQVAISFLGTVLDNGFGSARWQKWRPNIALHQRAAIGFIAHHSSLPMAFLLVAALMLFVAISGRFLKL